MKLGTGNSSLLGGELIDTADTAGESSGFGNCFPGPVKGWLEAGGGGGPAEAGEAGQAGHTGPNRRAGERFRDGSAAHRRFFLSFLSFPKLAERFGNEGETRC